MRRGGAPGRSRRSSPWPASPLAHLPGFPNFSFVREPGPSPLSLAGSMLIAHPGLMDPNFRRSVLLISTHEAEEGAFGLILNRPSGQTVAELLPNHEDLREIGSIPVLLGGPVARDQLIFASFIWHSD